MRRGAVRWPAMYRPHYFSTTHTLDSGHSATVKHTALEYHDGRVTWYVLPLLQIGFSRRGAIDESNCLHRERAPWQSICTQLGFDFDELFHPSSCAVLHRSVVLFRRK